MADTKLNTGSGIFLVNAIRVCVIAAFLAAATHSFARDPDNRYGESPHANWFRSLTQPGHSSASCCSLSDCLRTEQDMAGDHYRAKLPDGAWIDVPNEIVVTDRGNPVGEPILCATQYKNQSGTTNRLYCFVPGSGM